MASHEGTGIPACSQAHRFLHKPATGRFPSGNLRIDKTSSESPSRTEVCRKRSASCPYPEIDPAERWCVWLIISRSVALLHLARVTWPAKKSSAGPLGRASWSTLDPAQVDRHAFGVVLESWSLSQGLRSGQRA